jgi:Xaa-Pro aminopeptidase
VAATKALMRERDVPMLIAVVSGIPGRTGWIRYFSGTELSVPKAYVMIEREEPDPVIVLWSRQQAEWCREAVALGRVESTFDQKIPPLQAVIKRMGDVTGGKGRVGVLSLQDGLSWSEHQSLRAAHPHIELVDMTTDVDRLRQVKSSFELAAMQSMGALLDEGLNLFAALARPGRLRLEVAAKVEALFRSRGCFGGRVKYSLGERPYTVPPSPEERFDADDVLVFQFVYLSPIGYWYELSRLFSFKPLPAETARRLRAMEQAIDETAKAAVPGSTFSAISALADQVFRECGFDVIGKHTEDFHTIGTDIRDGYNITPHDWRIEKDMVLALHPASLLPGDLGFFLCDNFHVQVGGAVPLSPSSPRYRLLSEE